MSPLFPPIGLDPQADIPLRQIVAEVQEKYHFYFIVPGGAAYGADGPVLNFWKQLLGERNVIRLADPDDTSESIAMTIGLNEGVIGVNEAQEHLAKRGKLAAAIQRMMQAIGGLFGSGGSPPSTMSGTRRL